MPLLKHRITLSVFLFLISLTIGIVSIQKNRQLGLMGGFAEEHFFMGWNLKLTGSFFPDKYEPDVFYFGKNPQPIFRPPGYPVFVAVVMKAWDGLKERSQIPKNQEEFKQKLHDGIKSIYLSQCLLLGLSAAVLFLWSSKFLNHITAFTISLLFGCNPYMIILTGLLHYSILHIFFTILSCYALSCSLEENKYNLSKLIIAGILWGLTTLIRPVTLILPAFVIVLFIIQHRFSWQPLIKKSAIFIIGMLIVITPYTIRNYSLTEKFIPVNAQGGVALWAGTSRQLERNPNHYRWWTLWNEDGRPIYTRITKTPNYTIDMWVANVLELDNEFKEEALNNIYHQPNVFLHNFIQNFITFNLDINSVFIKVYQAIQNPDVSFQKDWIRVGAPQDFHSSSATTLFVIFIYLLELLSLGGIVIAIRKDTSILVPILIYFCFCIAHSITHMDLMYYYIKIPFIFIFAGYFLDYITHLFVNRPRLRMSRAIVFSSHTFLIIYGVGLTSFVLFNI